MSLRIECQTCHHQMDPLGWQPFTDVSEWRCDGCQGQVVTEDSPWAVLRSTIGDPIEALLWKQAVASPAPVAIWASHGFGPDEAARWLRRGWTADQAYALIYRVAPMTNLLDLDGQRWPEVDEWLATGISAAQALLAVAAGLSLAEALDQHNSGTWDEPALRALAALRQVETGDV